MIHPRISADEIEERIKLRLEEARDALRRTYDSPYIGSTNLGQLMMAVLLSIEEIKDILAERNSK